MEKIHGMQSMDECRESIKKIANNIHKDISSTLVNANRSTSLRNLLDLFDQYNDMLIEKNTMSHETLGELVAQRIMYTRFGKKYTKVPRDCVIKEGAMQSWCHGELQPITNSDGKTIGGTPSEFSDERDFYNPITKEEEC